MRMLNLFSVWWFWKISIRKGKMNWIKSNENISVYNFAGCQLLKSHLHACNAWISFIFNKTTQPTYKLNNKYNQFTTSLFILLYFTYFFFFSPIPKNLFLLFLFVLKYRFLDYQKAKCGSRFFFGNSLLYVIWSWCLLCTVYNQSLFKEMKIFVYLFIFHRKYSVNCVPFGNGIFIAFENGYMVVCGVWSVVHMKRACSL